MKGNEFSVSTGDLYAAYKAWCKDQGEKARSANSFGKVVCTVDGVQAKKNGSRGRYYLGLRPADAAAAGGG